MTYATRHLARCGTCGDLFDPRDYTGGFHCGWQLSRVRVRRFTAVEVTKHESLQRENARVKQENRELKERLCAARRALGMADDQ